MTNDQIPMTNKKLPIFGHWCAVIGYFLEFP
jgi:hypothetical protein